MRWLPPAVRSCGCTRPLTSTAGAENRTSRGVGGSRGAIPCPRPDRPSFPGAQNLIQLGDAAVEFLPQFGVPLDRVATDLLIGGRGHPIQVRDVGLQLRL